MTISYIWNTLSKQEEVTYEHVMHGICENRRHSLMETKFTCVDYYLTYDSYDVNQ